MANKKRKYNLVARKNERKRLAEFRIVENNSAKKSPQSLRKALYDIAFHVYNGDLIAASKGLHDSSMKRKGRTLNIKLTSNSLYDIIQDRAHIKYGHLDAFAQELGVPAALLLIYSRLVANQNDNNLSESRELVAAYQKIFGDIEEKLSDKNYVFSIKDFDKWCEIFREESLANGQYNLI